MRQSACLVINPITVDNFAALFNCTPVDRASDSMMAPDDTLVLKRIASVDMLKVFSAYEVYAIILICSYVFGK